MSFQSDITRTFSKTLYTNYNKEIASVTGPAVRASENILGKDENLQNKATELEEK